MRVVIVCTSVRFVSVALMANRSLSAIYQFLHSTLKRKAVEMAKGIFIGTDDAYQIVNTNQRVVDVENELTKWEATQSANYW